MNEFVTYVRSRVGSFFHLWSAQLKHIQTVPHELLYAYIRRREDSAGRHDRASLWRHQSVACVRSGTQWAGRRWWAQWLNDWLPAVSAGRKTTGCPPIRTGEQVKVSSNNSELGYLVEMKHRLLPNDLCYTEKKITPPGNHDPLFENKLTLMA